MLSYIFINLLGILLDLNLVELLFNLLVNNYIIMSISLLCNQLISSYLILLQYLTGSILGIVFTVMSALFKGSSVVEILVGFIIGITSIFIAISIKVGSFFYVVLASALASAAFFFSLVYTAVVGVVISIIGSINGWFNCLVVHYLTGISSFGWLSVVLWNLVDICFDILLIVSMTSVCSSQNNIVILLNFTSILVLLSFKLMLNGVVELTIVIIMAYQSAILVLFLVNGLFLSNL